MFNKWQFVNTLPQGIQRQVKEILTRKGFADEDIELALCSRYIDIEYVLTEED